MRMTCISGKPKSLIKQSKLEGTKNNSLNSATVSNIRLALQIVILLTREKFLLLDAQPVEVHFQPLTMSILMLLGTQLASMNWLSTLVEEKEHLHPLLTLTVIYAHTKIFLISRVRILSCTLNLISLIQLLGTKPLFKLFLILTKVETETRQQAIKLKLKWKTLVSSAVILVPNSLTNTEQRIWLIVAD